MTRELALLDDGLPLLFTVVADELVIVGSTQYYSDDQLTRAVEQVEQWVCDNALSPQGAYKLLAQTRQHSFYCGGVDLPSRPVDQSTT